jgi:hypothetical protein
MEQAAGFQQHPYVVFEIAAIGNAGATGDVQVLMTDQAGSNNVVLMNPVSIAANQGLSIAQRILLPHTNNFGQEIYFNIQGRRTNASGSLIVKLRKIYGCQS